MHAHESSSSGGWREQAVFGGLVLAGAVLFYWPALRYMFDMWSKPVFEGADYSHGYLIPFVTLFFVWRRRAELAAARGPRRPAALLLVGLALLLHIVGVRTQFLRFSLMSFILFLWSGSLYLFGLGVARRLIFPLCYLVFCIPLNFLDTLSFRLRMLTTVISAGLLNGLGIETARRGSAILAADFSFDVADPCSGIRSLLALTALTAAYANFSQRVWWKQWLLFLSSVPIAMVGNIARITTVGIVAQVWGQEKAVGVYHDWSGYIIYGVAVLMMLGVERVLKGDWRPRARATAAAPVGGEGRP